jgi:CHAT domain-containing protein
MIRLSFETRKNRLTHRKPRPLLMLGILALTLAGCATGASRQAIQGDFKGAADSATSGDYTKLSVGEHYDICNALLSLQRFSELDRCMAPLWRRAYTEDFTVSSLFTYNKDYTDILLHSIEAKKFIELGDLDRAHGHAEQAYEATKRNPRSLLNQAMSIYTSVMTLGLNNPNSDTGFRADADRTISKIEPYALMSIIEMRRNNLDRAASFRKQLQQIYDEMDKSTVDNKGQLAWIRRWLGQSYYVAGDYKAAYHTFTRDDRSHLEQARDAFFTGLLFVEKPFYEPFVFAAAGTTSDGLQFVTELPTKVMLYRSAFKTDQLAIARGGYDDLLREPLITGFASLHFRLLHERAQIAMQDGDRRLARKTLDQAIGVLESQRASLAQDDYKLGFVGDKIGVYSDMVGLLLADGQAKAAFEYAERAKARALVDLLASRKDFAAPKDEQGAALVRELDRLERQSIQLAANGGVDGRIRGVEVDTLRKSLATAAPELASLVTVNDSDISAIQRRLGHDEILIEYYGHEDKLFSFVVSRKDIHAVELDGKGLTASVGAFRDALRNPRSGAHNRATRTLYDRLLRPLQGALRGKLLTVVPHGPLHYLPFAALHDGERYLIERTEIRLLPSASVLAFLDKKTAATQDLLAFGNPDRNDPKLALPGAEAETRAIDQGRRNSRILLRKLASEANFKKFAPSFRYLHLASHGEFNADNPLQSRLLLAAGQGEDGNLTVNELYDLRLNAELVTLSACETGLGEIKSGDDVIGLTRGFLYAGARSTVTSLWPVSDDSTAHLMKVFYAKLKAGSKTSALRAALLSTKAKFSHPFYWSAFNLTGATN